MSTDEINGGPFDGWVTPPAARLMRPACSECSRTNLRWAPAARFVAVMAKVDEPRARETFEMFSLSGAGPTSPAWACECGAYGVVAIDGGQA